MSSERGHCEKVAREWLDTPRARADEGISLANDIERERAAAWLEGRCAGLDAAKLTFDDILKRAVAEARRQALEAAAVAVCCQHVGLKDSGECLVTCPAEPIRDLLEKP